MGVVVVSVCARAGVWVVGWPLTRSPLQVGGESPERHLPGRAAAFDASHDHAVNAIRGRRSSHGASDSIDSARRGGNGRGGV